jgi:hypothetical protein
MALLIAMCQGVAAGETLHHRLSCTLVRLYVAKYSAPAAEAYARSHGATDLEIDTARQCLGSTVQAASWASTSH